VLGIAFGGVDHDVHGRREHGPDLAVHREQLPVEVRHGRVGGRFEQKQ
jgi:hypothetical protein